MADHHLIEEYLRQLAAAVEGRPEADDVVAEVQDHLYTAAADRVRAGDGEEDAQRFALERFGEPTLVARSLRGAARSPAVPTANSRSTGTVALIAAGTWMVVATLWWAAQILDDGSWGAGAQVAFMLATTALVGSVALTVVVLHGLHLRHGGMGLVGLATLVVGGLAVAASFVSWFLPGWAALVGLAAAIGALPLVRRGMAPRGPLVALGLGWLLGAGAFVLLETMEVGTADEWGNHPAASTIGIGIGAIVTAVGLLGTGRWLSGEELAPQAARALPLD